jgi:hypothetical protein
MTCQNLLKNYAKCENDVRDQQDQSTLQCGKPFFSNTRQNGEWTETSTRQNEIKLAISITVLFY